MGLVSKRIIDIRTKLIKGITGIKDINDRKEIVVFCKNISPINYQEKTVPTMILHGNKDKITSIRHSKRLKKMLKKQNQTHELVIIENGDHGFKTTEKKLSG